MWCDPTVPQPPLDFRSDTVTKPDERMRAAMAGAKVGDDVLDHDPTMRELEDRVADLIGTESALWVPSGSMGNLVALFLHLNRGDRFLAPLGAHVLDNELGTAAWLAGGLPHPMDWDAGPGWMSARAIHEVAGREPGYDGLRTTLLCIENTHNAAGGAVLSLDIHVQLIAAARECRLLVHLDGARLWNAA
ncbi:MAG: low specificity L-threonine aldolase, partial [Kutzneria sp.]|nr:low specificity L-threonine aldolase [Kutzneria sp.]